MASDIFSILLFFIAFLGYKSIKIIRPYQKGLIERLGKFQRIAEPGLTVIIPFIDKIRIVDIREDIVDVPPQEVITKDNVVVTVDAVIYFEVTDPYKVVYNVSNFEDACTKLAQTNLRNLIGDLELDETLTSRDKINNELRIILDEATDKWGVRVTRVELQRIDPPTDVTKAMHKQMKAEREKRAIILKAEGQKQAAILKAEGQKQAAILKAEGQANAIREIAQAKRDKFSYEAYGRSMAIMKIFKAIKDADIDNDILSIQYIDTLKAAIDKKSRFLVVPSEFAEMGKWVSYLK